MGLLDIGYWQFGISAVIWTIGMSRQPLSDIRYA